MAHIFLLPINWAITHKNQNSVTHEVLLFIDKTITGVMMCSRLFFLKCRWSTGIFVSIWWWGFRINSRDSESEGEGYNLQVNVNLPPENNDYWIKWTRGTTATQMRKKYNWGGERKKDQWIL